jgi:predicted nucleotidyltransferase
MQTAKKSDVINIVKEFINSISEKYKIKNVYLFGSYSNETPNEYSDIDIAIILNEKVDATVDFDIFKKAQLFDPRIEPVVYSVSEFQQDITDIIVEVKQKGEKIA